MLFLFLLLLCFCSCSCCCSCYCFCFCSCSCCFPLLFSVSLSLSFEGWEVAFKKNHQFGWGGREPLHKSGSNILEPHSKWRMPKVHRWLRIEFWVLTLLTWVWGNIDASREPDVCSCFHLAQTGQTKARSGGGRPQCVIFPIRLKALKWLPSSQAHI